MALKRRKPIRLKPIQQFQLTGIVIRSAGWKIADVIAVAKKEGITQVNENHVRGIAKSHGVKLLLKTRGLTPAARAEKARVSYMALCNEADIDPADFLPSGVAETPAAAAQAKE